MPDMKAAVIYEAGGPEVLKIQSRPIPTPRPDEVLIRVKAFGLNRSELFTRQGHSSGVKFPRVLGIEAVGLVESAPGNEFPKGAIVATAMGGLGREFDGGYAEYTCAPAKGIQAIKTQLPWKRSAPFPRCCKLHGARSSSLFVSKRASISSSAEARPLSALRRLPSRRVTVPSLRLRLATRNAISCCWRSRRRPGLHRHRLDRRTGQGGRRRRCRQGPGTDRHRDLKDSLSCARQGGIVCMTGIVGNKWSFDDFAPMEAIPSAIYLTSYNGKSEDFMRTPLDELAQQIGSAKIARPDRQSLSLRRDR